MTAELDALLAEDDAERAAGYPGDRAGRQPVQTAYLPADRFGAGSVRQWGSQALAVLAEAAPDAAAFASATGLAADLAERVRPLVVAKLTSEPVEDLRIDFEDGYGNRTDGTEDAHARAAARAIAAMYAAPGAPPFCGLRCKSLDPAGRRRAIATLDAFIGMLTGAGRPLPDGFVLTLPKVTSVAQVRAMAVACERLEAAHGLRAGRLMFEVQVEMPQLIVGADGTATVARCVHAASGRLAGLHYGTYDYSAAVGIAAAQQSLAHPAADHARAVMQAAAAGTGVRLSDGSSNVLPVGGPDAVTAAWRLHAGLVRRSLERGFYQGWDLHPAQLVSRYAATFAYYLEGLPAAAERLGGYAARAAAGLEEPATARALAGYLLRGLECGAFGEGEVAAASGFGRAELGRIRRSGFVPDRPGT
ncbi:MAG: DUF6986 family protein [Streptosporangiaceae bacterium]